MTFARSAVPGLAILTALITMASPVTVEARERLTYVQGMKNCTAFCDSNNRTEASRRKCYGRCDLYWSQNASDAASVQVDGL